MPYVVRNPDRISRLVLYGTSPWGPLARNASREHVEDRQLRLKAIELAMAARNSRLRSVLDLASHTRCNPCSKPGLTTNCSA